MPWGPNDASSHTKNADTPKLKKLWAETANSALIEYKDDATAIRVANAAVNRAKKETPKDSVEEKSNKIIRDLKNITDRF